MSTNMGDPFIVDDASVEYLQTTLEQLSETAGYRMSLENLLDRWRRFVSDVERGYSESIYEYANDLCIRNLLKVIEANAPLSLRTLLASHLAPLDYRFFEATHAVTKAIPGLVKQPDTPWSVRIPNRVSGELLDDLRAQGLMSS